ncbi:MAG: helix-turn-helix domain-containing protein [Hyphomicrobiaceae bacterium]
MFDDDDDDNDDSPFLTIDETAKLLRVNRRTLDNLRWSGDGPPARRHGGRVVYHRREVLDWSERRRTRRPDPERTDRAPPPTHGDAGTQRPCGSKSMGEPPTPPVEYEP